MKEKPKKRDNIPPDSQGRGHEKSLSIWDHILPPSFIHRLATQKHKHKNNVLLSVAVCKHFCCTLQYIQAMQPVVVHYVDIRLSALGSNLRSRAVFTHGLVLYLVGDLEHSSKTYSKELRSFKKTNRQRRNEENNNNNNNKSDY